MGNSYLRTPTLWEQGARSLKGQKAMSAFETSSVARASFLQEETFHSLLTLERRRAERSRKPFVLMVLEVDASLEANVADRILSQVTSVLLKSTRETALIGWYKNGASLDGDGATTVAGSRLYPARQSRDTKKYLPQTVKRVIDIVGSGVLLLFLSPLLAAIALAIKLTSKGPVLFRQDRLGQFGAPFKCLKFRTMAQNNDPRIHQEYIRRFIVGQSSTEETDPGKPVVYKLTNDPRVTKIGRFLRKTSLDEFP